MESSNQDSPSYYSILGVVLNFLTPPMIKSAVLIQWHPDKWAKNPSLLGEAKAKFQQIQEAYSVEEESEATD